MPLLIMIWVKFRVAQDLSHNTPIDFDRNCVPATLYHALKMCLLKALPYLLWAYLLHSEVNGKSPIDSNGNRIRLGAFKSQNYPYKTYLRPLNLQMKMGIYLCKN